MSNNIQLFASDLDGTLISTTGKTDPAAIKLFARNIKCAAIPTAYITGRHFELALDGIERTGLPLPQYLICDVGTSLYTVVNGRWQQDYRFTEELLHSWNGKTAEEICLPIIEQMVNLIPQEANKQSECKYSFYFKNVSEAPKIAEKVNNILSLSGYEADIVSSIDPVNGLGLLDLLPGGSGKAKPLYYLAESHNLTLDEIAFAGDSGNDLLAMATGVRSIVVGNASEDLVKPLKNKITLGEIRSENIYFASGSVVAGVIEGCQHFQLFDQH